MPTAKKLPSGSWRCQVFSHYENVKAPDGTVKKKRIYESFTCDDPSPRGKKAAEKMAAEFAYDKERRSRIDLTVREAMERYIQSRENIASPTTIRGYKILMRNAYTSLENKKTRRLTQYDIQEWTNAYALNHSPKTVSNAHGLLNAVLSVYEPDLHLKTKLPARMPTAMYVPTDADIKALLSAVHGTEMEKAVLLAAFGTLRRGEICALTSDDIQGDTIIINKAFVRSDKGKFVSKSPKTASSVRYVVYPHFVIERLQGIQGRLVNIHPEDISKKFGSILKKAGIPHFRFHDLRHYSASIMHALGIPDQYIMERGGWQTDKVLKAVYRNVMPDKQEQFTAMINSHFESMQHEMQHDNKKAP